MTGGKFYGSPLLRQMVFSFASNFEFSAASMSTTCPCSGGVSDTAGLASPGRILDVAGLAAAIGWRGPIIAHEAIAGLRYRLALRGLRHCSLGKRAKRRNQHNNFHFILPKVSSVRTVPPFCRRRSIHWGSIMTPERREPAGSRRRVFLGKSWIAALRLHQRR